MNEKITFILPSRSREKSFFDTLNNIIENSINDNYEIICTLDLDDIIMCNDSVKEKLESYKKVTTYWGTSKDKVDAINKNCDKIPVDTDIVILISDDQKFIVKGFDEIIRMEMIKWFPDMDGVLHFQDNTPARDKLITMNIMSYNYFKRFDYLYNPEYKNVYVDNCFTETAKRLGKYKLIPNHKIYIHNHAIWGTAPMDDLYKRNEEPISYQKDKDTYFRHLANNFGI